MIFKRHLVLPLLLWCFTCSGNTLHSQSRNPQDLTRSNVVVNSTRATVYLCIDKSRWHEKRPGNLLWLRLYNNTIWTIRFKAEKEATLQKPLKLANGPRVPGLTDKSTAFPQYQLESKTTGQQLDYPGRSHFGTASWLPSKTSTLFAVPVDTLKDARFFLEYKYQWEFAGAIGDESNGPVHRVYFDLPDQASAAALLCN